MAVVSTGSGSEGVGGFKKPTGLLKIKDVIINPTLKELNDYGINWVIAEPDYSTKDDDGIRGNAITIYAKIDPTNFKAEDAKAMGQVIINHRFYVYDKVRQNNEKTKTQFINALGNTTWADSIDTLPEFFNKEGARPALIGEEAFVNFVKAWGDIRKDNQCILDTFTNGSIFDGNYTELKQLQVGFSNHKLKVLIGLKDAGDDKFYNVMYGKMFWRVFATKMKIKENGVWVDKEFSEAIPAMLSEQYMDFSRADDYTIAPVLWDNSQLKSPKPDADPVANASVTPKPSINDIF